MSENGHDLGAEGLEDVGVPSGAKPDEDNPGWYSWGDFPRGSFAGATGRLLFKPDGPGRGMARMFPTEAHMNMGGSIHGGAVMSFIDMAMFAGGRCAGMAQGHYVTLNLTTHFLARGQDRCSARRSCGAGEADPQPRLPSRRRQAGRRGLLQLHGHAEAHQREERSGMSGPVGRAYSDLIRAGELKPDTAAGTRRVRARQAGG